MKIRDRMIASHIAVALIPILVALLAISLASRQAVNKELAGKLDSLMDNVYDRINDDIDHYRKHATLFAGSLSRGSSMEHSVLTPEGSYSLAKYDIDIAEFTARDKIYRTDFLDTAYAPYATSPQFAVYLWNYLSDPSFHRQFDIYLPQIVSNLVVVRCAALCYDYIRNEKTGLAVTTLVLDQSYLSKFSDNNGDLVVFYQTPYGIVFSSNNLRMRPDYLVAIAGTNTLDGKHLLRFNFAEQGTYFVKKTELFKIPNTDQKIYVGILYGYQFIKRFDTMIRVIMLVILVVSLAFALPVAYISTHRIVTPLELLNSEVQRFKKDFTPIPGPPGLDDEVSQVHKTFSEMSASIVDYSRKLESYQKRLAKEVDEKTTDLKNKIQVLMLINNFSSFTIRTDTQNEADFIRQIVVKLKELFHLKHIAVYSHLSRNPERLQFITAEKKLLRKERGVRILSIETALVNRLKTTGSAFARNAGDYSVIITPIYFIDQIEYSFIYLCSREESKLLPEALDTINNLISLKIYSIRYQAEKLQSEKLASIGQFAGTIVHDIKNPLTVIKSSVEMLSDDDFTPEEKEHYLSILRSELDMLTGMLNDILDFSRGKISLVREPVILDEMLDELCDFYSKAVRSKNITLYRSLDSGVTLNIDRQRVWRALSNLISNSLDVLSEGGQISVRSEKKIVDVRIVIEDNGPGIPAEIADKIFEPFVTFGKKGGTGLGLSIVKKIIDSHGGNINYKTERGQGTSFYISFPL